VTGLPDGETRLKIYWVGQIRRGQCSFFRRSKARFGEFLAGEITVHLRTFRSIKIKYFSSEGATKTCDFLCSSILGVLLTHTFYIKRFYQQRTSSSTTASC